MTRVTITYYSGMDVQPFMLASSTDEVGNSIFAVPHLLNRLSVLSSEQAFAAS